jgi:hypothetical protein
MRDLGEAAAMIDTAKLILFHLTGELDAVAMGAEFPLANKARHRAQGAQMIQLVHQASESLMFQAGSSAFSLEKPISRYWKDVSMALRHIQNIPTIGSPPGAY